MYVQTELAHGRHQVHGSLLNVTPGESSMSSVVAIVKSIVGQVFVVSPEGIRRVLVEGDKLFAGDQIDTGLSGAVSLELADGRTLDLGRDTQWSADSPDSSADLVAATAQAAPSVEELQQAIAAGADPTKDLEATAAGPTAARRSACCPGVSIRRHGPVRPGGQPPTERGRAVPRSARWPSPSGCRRRSSWYWLWMNPKRCGGGKRTRCCHNGSVREIGRRAFF